MLQVIGKRLAEVHAIAKPDDVFWLKVDELEAAANALDANQPVQDFRGVVAGRRATWERERMVTPPVNLPLKGGARFWGIDWSNWMPARTNQAAGNTIKGIGASPGRVTAIARVIHDPGEFSRMQPNDILVAKITTPAWTPLFALASGVVTDVGGLLSHSSIVAREYHIPAVLGTGVATERIHSGQRIMVDGDGGVVTTGG
jgi:pyruvate,water dikinase